jgi:hypothetical protein
VLRVLIAVLLIFLALLAIVFCVDVSRTMMQSATCDPAALIARANRLETTGDVRTDLFELNVLAMDVQIMNRACIAANYNLTPMPTAAGPTNTPTATALPNSFEIARR